MKSREKYFLLGSEFCDAFESREGEVDQIDLKNLSGNMFKYDPDVDDPQDLVSAAIGWHEFIEISKNDFETLLKIHR